MPIKESRRKVQKIKDVMFTLEESKSIVNVLPKKFDSHEFIRVGALIATSSFLTLIKRYEGNFTTIDAQIGLELRRQADKLNIKIKKVGDVTSETIIGTESECALWEKI